jgi:hypothetical protein
MEREPTEGQGSLPGVPRPRGRPRGAEQPFPIVEAFGYAWDAVSPERDAAFREKWCRFMGADCEKYRQYRLGSCSVTYAARDDDRVRYTLDALAVQLGILGVDFDVREPTELVEYIRTLADRYRRATP